MWFYLFHVLHVGRGIMGLYIGQKVPYPQNFVKVLKDDAKNNQRYSFDEYSTYAEQKLEETVANMFKNIKDYLMIYFLVTCLTLTMDNIDMAI